jgi:hypothetical protein
MIQLSRKIRKQDVVDIISFLRISIFLSYRQIFTLSGREGFSLYLSLHHTITDITLKLLKAGGEHIGVVKKEMKLPFLYVRIVLFWVKIIISCANKEKCSASDRHSL